MREVMMPTSETHYKTEICSCCKGCTVNRNDHSSSVCIPLCCLPYMYLKRQQQFNGVGPLGVARSQVGDERRLPSIRDVVENLRQPGVGAGALLAAAPRRDECIGVVPAVCNTRRVSFVVPPGVGNSTPPAGKTASGV